MNSIYQERTLISNITYHISDNHIAIYSPNTCWINLSRVSKINREEIDLLYQKVYSLAKEQDVFISRVNGLIGFYRKNWIIYEVSIKAADKLYDEMFKIGHLIKENGIYRGYSNDVLINALLEKQDKYMQHFYRTSTISKMQYIFNELVEYEKALSKPNNIKKIYL